MNFRTFPLLPAHGTFVAKFDTGEEASEFCVLVAHSFLTPQIVEIADSGAGRFLYPQETVEGVASRFWSVIVSVVGHSAVVERHAHELSRLAGEANAEEFSALGESESAPLLTRVREFPRIVLESAPLALIFRCNLTPSAVPSARQEFREIAKRASFDLMTLTRASGILYASFSPLQSDTLPDACAQLAKDVLQRNASSEASAQSMLEWCPPEVKRLVGDVWGPPRADLPLMKKLKNSFDPQNVLSPGRFAGGI